MKKLAYLDDLKWINDSIGFMKYFNISLDTCIHSNAIAEKTRDYFRNIYIINGDNYLDLSIRFLDNKTEGYDLIFSHLPLSVDYSLVMHNLH
jgi:hypothetical protein